MFDEHNLNKTGKKKRKNEEVKQVLDNCTGHDKYQLVKFIRENAATDIQKRTINNFYHKGKFFRLIWNCNIANQGVVCRTSCTFIYI